MKYRLLAVNSNMDVIRKEDFDTYKEAKLFLDAMQTVKGLTSWINCVDNSNIEEDNQPIYNAVYRDCIKKIEEFSMMYFRNREVLSIEHNTIKLIIDMLEGQIHD